MYQSFIVLASMTLVAINPSESAAGTRRPRACCPQRIAYSAPHCGAGYSYGADAATGHHEAARVDPCYCLKEALETYPTSSGFETLYLAERHDDGCPPTGNCQFPETTYIADSPNQSPEDCSSDECSPRKSLSRGQGLKKPVKADHQPKLDGDLNEIAEVIHTDYIVFRTPQRGWIRAIVHIVKLPLDPVIRPGQPVRIVAYGFEVEAGPTPKPLFEVDRRYVRSTSSPSLFMVDCGGVRYAIVVTQ